MAGALPQLVANALVSASTVLVVAVGFAIVFDATRFFHFAHGAIFTLGAYVAFAAHRLAGLPLEVAFLVSMAASAVLGCLLELGVYRPLRRKGASALVLLIASLGLYVVVENAIGLLFGDDTKSIRGSAMATSVAFLGMRFTVVQVATIVTSAALVVASYLVVRRTRVGKAMRAVANDPELASISGVEANRVLLWALGVGSALAGAAGTLVALDVDLVPTMGLAPFMLAVVAVVVGGRGNLPGIALASLLLGLAQQLGGWWLGAVWHDVLAFVVLLVFLVVRPRGVLGRRARLARA